MVVETRNNIILVKKTKNNKKKEKKKKKKKGGGGLSQCLACQRVSLATVHYKQRQTR